MSKKVYVTLPVPHRHQGAAAVYGHTHGLRVQVPEHGDPIVERPVPPAKPVIGRTVVVTPGPRDTIRTVRR